MAFAYKPHVRMNYFMHDITLRHWGIQFISPFFCKSKPCCVRHVMERATGLTQRGQMIMKFIDHKNSVAIIAALVLLMTFVMNMIGAPSEPVAAYPEKKDARIILASAHSGVAPQSPARSDTLPAPCPIWMISQLTRQEGKSGQSNGDARSPQLVPAALWFMQKFGQALVRDR